MFKTVSISFNLFVCLFFVEFNSFVYLVLFVKTYIEIITPKTWGASKIPSDF